MVLRRQQTATTTTDEGETDMSDAEAPNPYADNAVSPQASETLGQSAALVEWFTDTFPTSAEDTFMIQARIVDKILATSADSILDMDEGLPSANDLIRVPLEITDIDSVMPSSYGGIYIVLKARNLETGEIFSFAAGSPTILAQLKVIYEAKKLPIECKIMPIARGKKDGKNPPLYLRKLSF